MEPEEEKAQQTSELSPSTAASAESPHALSASTASEVRSSTALSAMPSSPSYGECPSPRKKKKADPTAAPTLDSPRKKKKADPAAPPPSTSPPSDRDGESPSAGSAGKKKEVADPAAVPPSPSPPHITPASTAAPSAGRETPSPTPSRKEVDPDPALTPSSGSPIPASPMATPSDTPSVSGTTSAISGSSGSQGTPNEDSPLQHIGFISDHVMSSTAQTAWDNRRKKNEKRKKEKKEKTEKKKEGHDLQPPPSPLPYKVELPELNQAEHSSVNLEHQFLGFLTGNNREIYKSQLLGVEPVLCIDFMHLLAENKDLAMAICNQESKQSETWLTPSLKMFATKNGCAAEKVSPHFINKPERVYTAKELLSSQHALTVTRSIFCGNSKREILIATPRLQILFSVVLWGILREFENGNSWLGTLTVDDLFITKVSGQLQLVILKDPDRKGDATPNDGVLDVNNVWSVMEAFISSDGKLPLYFVELKHVLTSVKATEFQEEWFREYLKFHPAFASPTDRKYLIVGLHQNSKAFRFEKSTSNFNNFFQSCPPGEDWRCSVITDEILNLTYYYNQNLLKKKLSYKHPAEVTVFFKKKKAIAGEKDGKSEADDVMYFDHPELVEVLREKPDEVKVGEDAGKDCKRNAKEKAGDVGKLEQVAEQEVKDPRKPQEEVVECKEDAIQEAADVEKLEQVMAQEGKDPRKPQEEVDECKYDVIQEAADVEKLEQVMEQEGKDPRKPQEEVDDVGEVEQMASDAGKIEQLAAMPENPVKPLELVGDVSKAPGKSLEEVLFSNDYQNTMGSLLKFSRHSLTHTNEVVRVSDLEDVEIYGAHKNGWFLPSVIKEFLVINRMKERLHNTWSTYKASIMGHLVCSSTH